MRLILVYLCIMGISSCHTNSVVMEQIATFKGQQVTGLTVTNQGRIFACFPRWRLGVIHSVVELGANHQPKSFPDRSWNDWEVGAPVTDKVFCAVQSVVAFEKILYVLDTRNPLFSGVLGNPKIFAFDLETNQLLRVYDLDTAAFHPDSYINDLCIDKRRGKIYLTDSGHAGLVVVDIETGRSFRVLDNHISTLAETNELKFDNGVWKNTVHSDGIALDTQRQVLYFHALTGYSLYAVSTQYLQSQMDTSIAKQVERVATTPAPDGMIYDGGGHLYMADLENNKIIQYDIERRRVSDFAVGTNIKWADSFSIFDGHLYFTNSRINEVQDAKIHTMEFSIYRIKLP